MSQSAKDRPQSCQLAIRRGEKKTNTKPLPRIVSGAEWQTAHESLLVKEKAATRARDALAAERRRLPMVQIEKDYVFAGEKGKARLLDLFEGRTQLIVYHFMFAPTVDGWPDAALSRVFVFRRSDRPSCAPASSRYVICAGIARAAGKHQTLLEAHGLGRAVVHPTTTISTPTLASQPTTVRRFWPEVFLRDDSRIFRTYFTTRRGVEALGSAWTFLCRLALARARLFHVLVLAV